MKKETVIGKTKSDKNIYENFANENHINFISLNSGDDFDPMSESSFQPQLVSEEKYNEIKANDQKIKSFHTKFAIIRAKYEATFVDGIASEDDWTNEDASLYEQYATEKNNLPVEWNINGYKISE